MPDTKTINPFFNIIFSSKYANVGVYNSLLSCNGCIFFCIVFELQQHRFLICDEQSTSLEFHESCCCGSDGPEVVYGLLGSGSGDGPLALVLDAGLGTSGLCGSARSDRLAFSLTLPLAPVWEESAGVGVLMGRWSRKTKTV